MALRSPDQRRRQAVRLQGLAVPPGQSRVDCRLRAATLRLRAHLVSPGPAAARTVRRFEVTTPPEAEICKECDLRTLCGSQGVIRRSEMFA